jgi:hypothetical protein
MPACNRRTFMARVLVGTAALATAGRALANPDSGAGANTGSGSGSVPQEGCGNCQFYTPAPGATTGTCAFAGKTVNADDGCGEFIATSARTSRSLR